MSNVVVSEDKLEKIVERVVNRKLLKLLSDPDYGLTLKESFIAKLTSVRKNGGEHIDEDKIAEKYNVRLM